MDTIFERIKDAGGTVKRDPQDTLFIGRRLREIEEDFNGGIMLLCGGDILQFQELKKMSVGEYLTKLDNFVSRLEK